ncbi:hypothetical protein DCC85_02020 [Paenibacillus sp. CAA11]|uniref:hypothetical protein n=1 Tax=Paenibacillus sp. CAA11 TaxID=1532905 RepID=UPI000D3D639B|nr:hypothetical protein [Paenibacillus sp. CAA11]AWB43126.1 hypothetical protein DCC85_02020 [Paenibacillus sp. CAA11]
MKLKEGTVVAASISLILILGAVSAFAEQSNGEVSHIGHISTEASAEMEAVESGDDTGLHAAASSSSFEEGEAAANYNGDALKEYTAYGLTYDKAKDRYLYQGKHVRLFMDQDPEEPGQFTKFYYDGDGTVDFQVVRDESKKVSKIAEVSDRELQVLGKTYGFELKNGGLQFKNVN